MLQTLVGTATTGILEWSLKDSNNIVLRKKLVRASEVTAEYELDKQRQVETLKFYQGNTELMGISSDSQSPDYNNLLDSDGASSGMLALYDNWFYRYTLA